MLQTLGNQLGLSPFGQAPTQPSGLGNLLAGGLKCTQNEQRLYEEKAQRNLLRKYLTQAGGDPIQSALISNTIPGKGFGDTFDVGLGTKRSIMQSLGLGAQPAQTNLLGSLAGLGQPQPVNTGLLGNIGNVASLANTVNQGTGLMNSLGGNTSTLGTLGTLGSLASLGQSKTANTGLLSSLVSMASTPNNNGNILNSLGGLGGGLFGNNTASTGTGLLGNIQSGINTLNTINKVNNAVSGVKGLFA
jgi:hypothetical protein